MTPPSLTAVLSALKVQLAAVPVPITVGLETSAGWPLDGTPALHDPLGFPAIPGRLPPVPVVLLPPVPVELLPPVPVELPPPVPRGAAAAGAGATGIVGREARRGAARVEDKRQDQGQ